jgi:hypothetical protein
MALRTKDLPMRKYVNWALILLLFPMLSSCAALGVAAHAFPQIEKPKYRGFQNQSVGVMIWADQGIIIDWSMLQLDLANSIQKKLKEVTEDEFKGATFPVQPASIVRYQKDHPGIESAPVTDIAPKLHVTRLIYIEVADFRTRPEASMDLYRGSITAKINVLEVNNGVATIAYTDEISATYPRKAPDSGVANIGDYKTYTNTIDAFTTEVVHKFVPYDKEDED